MNAARRYATAAVLPTATLMLGAKLHKLAILATGPLQVPLDVGAALALVADALWIGALLAGFAVAAALPAGWPRRVGMGLGHLTLAATGLLVAIEHAFFLSTGSLLDYPMVTYTVRHLTMLQHILASEVHVGSVVGLLALVGLTWLPLLSPALRARWRGDDAPQATPLLPDRGRALAAIALAALVLLGASVPTAAVARRGLAGPLQPLADAPSLTLALSALVDAASDGEVVVQQGERPAEPLVVRRSERSRPLNVVLVALESVRASATTPYNPTLATTPFLDGVARRGVRVDRAYTAVPHTTKSLVPIHCGYYPKITPNFDEANAGALPTECLAGTLARLGWATSYFQTSEDVFEKNAQLVRNFGYRDATALRELKAAGLHERFATVGYFGLEDQAMVAPILQWIDANARAAPGRPWMIGIVTLASHHPYEVPKGWARKHFADDPKLDDYLNAVAYTDAALAALHDGLKARGELERTLFLYVGDHGEGFGEHGLRQHDALLYEEGIRVPMLIEAPGLKPQVIGGLRQNVDLVPTALELLGLEPLVGSLDGQSVLSTPGHARLPLSCWHRDKCLAEIAADGSGLRKTIWHYDKRPPEVYDLVADPQETRDLVAAGEVDAAQLAPALARVQRWKQAATGRYSGQDARRARTLVSKELPAWLRDGPGARPPHDTRFGDGGGDVVQLLDVQWESQQAESGGSTHVRLVWKVLATPKPDWVPFLHGESFGKLVLRAHHVPAEGTHPLDAWQPGDVIVDRVFVRPEPGTRGGAFDVLIGFWNPKTGERLRLTRCDLPRAVDDRVLLGTLQISNPDRPAPPGPARSIDVGRLTALRRAPALAGPRPLDLGFALAGSSTPLVKLRRLTTTPGACPGGLVTLELGFEVPGELPRHTQLFVHLRGPGGRHRNLGFTPLGGKLPVDAWRAGDSLVVPETLRLPQDWPLGPTEVLLGFYGPNIAKAPGQGGGRLQLLGAPGGDVARPGTFDVGACR